MRAGIGNRSLATEGIKVRVVADYSGIRCDDSGRAERVLHIILCRAACGEKTNPFATKEDEFVLGDAGSICFREDFIAGAVPIELAADFGDSAAIAVISLSGSVQVLLASDCIIGRRPNLVCHRDAELVVLIVGHICDWVRHIQPESTGQN